MMEKPGEKELIEEIRNGETALFSRLIDRYNRKVFSLVFRISGNREDAEELTQDVFVKAYFSLRSYRGDSSFSTWLYRIAYNCAVSQVRKGRMSFSDSTEVSDLPGDAAEEEYDRKKEYSLQLLERAMERISAEERVLLSLYYKEGKSIGELAYIMGLSASNLKIKLYRTRKRLAALIDEERKKDGRNGESPE